MRHENFASFGCHDRQHETGTVRIVHYISGDRKVEGSDLYLHRQAERMGPRGGKTVFVENAEAIVKSITQVEFALRFACYLHAPLRTGIHTHAVAAAAHEVKQWHEKAFVIPSHRSASEKVLADSFPAVTLHEKAHAEFCDQQGAQIGGERVEQVDELGTLSVACVAPGKRALVSFKKAPLARSRFGMLANADAVALEPDIPEPEQKIIRHMHQQWLRRILRKQSLPGQ
ncbi:MAG TPA: hypothetical protein VHX61_05180 [Rhizomicrobium sp.]|nr:hypothetical protein [Rhizomicrobium sp.]